MGEREVVYGRNPVREALRGRRTVHRVFVLPPRARGAAAGEEVVGWARDAGLSAPIVEVVSPERLVALVGSPDHQGLAAEVGAYPYRDPDAILAGHDLIVALDRIQDPQNLGAIIRTAEVAGAAVVIPRHRTAVITPAVVKASAGATEHADVAQVRNLTDFLVEAQRAGFWVYGADAGARAAHTDQDLRGRTVFVLGSEGEGLGRRVADACDVLVAIPQWGRVGSLNVSVSAGILLFEARRQSSGRAPAGASPLTEAGSPESRGGPRPATGGSADGGGAA